MATRVASLFAEIGLKTDKFNADMNKVKGELGKAGNEFKNLGKSIKGAATRLDDTVQSLTGFSLAQLSAAGATAILIKQMADSVREAEESARTQAQLEAVITSTGAAAGMTAEEINAMSQDLSKLTGIEDDLLVKNSALLLTFKEVGEDVFPRAMKAAADMSAVIGQDLQSSVIQLGKALNDPIIGMSALQRVGVSFTVEQTAMIKGLVKSGQVLEAQKLILIELESEFGGAAQAMHEAGSGSDDLRNSIGNLKETFGTGLLPVVRNTNAELTKWIDIATKGIQVENDLLAAADKGIITQTQANNMITIGTWTAKGRAQAQEYLNKKTEEYNKLYQRSIPIIRNFKIEETQVIEEEIALAKAIELSNTELDKSIAYKKSLASLDVMLLGKFNEMTSLMNGPMLSASEEYNASMGDLSLRAAELQGEIDILAGKKWLSKSQRKDMEDARGELSETKKEMGELTEEYDKATKKIVLDFVMQAAAADGVITQQEFDKVAALGKEWGFFDDAAAKALRNSKAYLEDAGMSVDEFERKLGTTTESVGRAYSKVREFGAEWAKLKDKKITLTVTVKGNTLPTEGGTRPGAGKAAGGPVRGGTPYLVGERGPEMFVPNTSGNIVPNNQMSKSGGGNTFGDINIFVEGGDADATADAVFSRFSEATRAASNAGIGFAG